jgi:hypothetical protein
MTGIELHKRYVKLHLACLQMFLTSDYMADEKDRVSAPRAVWKAMGDAMDALGEAEKERVVLLMTPDEVNAMLNEHVRLSAIVHGSGSEGAQ